MGLSRILSSRFAKCMKLSLGAKYNGFLQSLSGYYLSERRGSLDLKGMEVI